MNRTVTQDAEGHGYTTITDTELPFAAVPTTVRVVLHDRCEVCWEQAKAAGRKQNG
jgi:hypothetical protein